MENKSSERQWCSTWRSMNRKPIWKRFKSRWSLRHTNWRKPAREWYDCQSKPYWTRLSNLCHAQCWSRAQTRIALLTDNKEQIPQFKRCVAFVGSASSFFEKPNRWLGWKVVNTVKLELPETILLMTFGLGTSQTGCEWNQKTIYHLKHGVLAD